MTNFINENEKGDFAKFFDFVYDNYKLEFLFVYSDGSQKTVKYFTSANSDNDLDLDDPNYEEYWEIYFQNLETQEYCEINYHNLPDKVYCDGKLVFEKQCGVRGKVS